MANIGWDKNSISIDVGGQTIRAVSISPPIISASRSTDIPAYYSDWFIQRLREGYAVWVNPMNQRAQIVNFEKLKFVVFWTKNAAPLQKRLGEIDKRGIKYYFQYTLNDYERENLEPNVPPLAEKINSFIQLSDFIGKEKVIWRFDPLILSDQISVDTLIERIKRIGDILHPYTEKLVFSFIDINIYNAVKKKIDEPSYCNIREFSESEMREFAEKVEKVNKKWGLEIATCGEMIDLSMFEIHHNKCIDPKLIKRICTDDLEFVKYINEHSEKDRGQRTVCGCVPSKDIGMYNTCMHQCVYCYANHYNKSAINNYLRHLDSKNSATINGSDNWKNQLIDKKNSQMKLDV